MDRALKRHGFGGLLWELAVRFYRKCMVALATGYSRVLARKRYAPPTQSLELREVQRRVRAAETDICDHLEFMFIQALQTCPSTIVELGVRGGESTFVFERVARISGASLVSVDATDCSDVCAYEKWHFVEADDVGFGREFDAWCAHNGVDCPVDVLFVDTSHEYMHTKQEVATWLPHLRVGGVAMFHDTHMSTVYRRSDRSLGVGWDNQRGVIRALEDFLGCTLKEDERFVTVLGDFIVDHRPSCSGLTSLWKLSCASLGEATVERGCG